MRLVSLQEPARTLGIRSHLPRNSTTYHCVYNMWLTCGGKPQVRFRRQRGAHYTTLQGKMSSAEPLFTNVQSRNSVVHLNSITLNVQHAAHRSCSHPATPLLYDVTTAKGLADLCIESYKAALDYYCVPSREVISPNQACLLVIFLDRTLLHNLIHSFGTERKVSFPATLGFEDVADRLAYCQQASVVIAWRDK